MCQHVSNDPFWINLPCFNHQLIASHAGHVSRCEAWTSNMPSSSSFVLASFELFSYVTNNFLLSLWEKNYASSTPPDFLHYFQSKQVHTFYLYSPMCRVKWPVYVIGFTLKLKLICWFFPSMFGLLNSVSPEDLSWSLKPDFGSLIHESVWNKQHTMAPMCHHVFVELFTKICFN
jgi:hypothetical protein